MKSCIASLSVANAFPELPAMRVEAAVVGKYGDFQDSRVRDFVPILV